MRKWKLIIVISITIFLVLTLSACSDSIDNVKTITVTFDTMGGSEIGQITINENSKIPELPSNPLRPCFSFDGWYLDDSYTIHFLEDQVLNDNITLYAKWKENHHFNTDCICETCGYFDSGLELQLNDDEESYTIIGIGTFSGTDLVIPPVNYDTKPITKIGFEAFSGCYNILAMYIPYTINEIDTANGFIPNLTNIYLDEYSESFTLKEGALYKKDYSTLYSVPLNVKTLTIPEETTYITDSAFLGDNKRLESVYYEGTFDDWCHMQMGWASTSPFQFAEHFYINGEELIGDIVIPDDITELPHSLFAYSQITSVVIPEGVTKIGNYVFRGCSDLSVVTLPKTLQYIGQDAFCGCDKLLTVVFNGTVENWMTIEFNYYHDLFNNVNKFYIDGVDIIENGLLIPKVVTNIPNNCFENLSTLTKVEFEDESQLRKIGLRAFYGCCGLTNLIIPDTVTYIGEWAFSSCTRLTSVTLGNSLRYIDTNAFKGCKLLWEIYNKSSLTLTKGSMDYGSIAYYVRDIYTDIYESKISIEDGYVTYTDGDDIILAKYYGSDYTLILPEGITKISSGAFDKCESIISITLPESLEYIEDKAFTVCYRLVEIYNKSSLSLSIGDWTHGWIGLYAKDIYTEAYDSKISVDSYGYITYIDNDEVILIGYIGKETNLTLPKSITRINEHALMKYDWLTSITIPETVTYIGAAAFLGCSKLNTITIPETITRLRDRLFENCYSLSNVTIPSSVTDIGDRVFCECRNLTSITIPESVTNIPSNTFFNCTGLTSVTMPNNITSIGDYSFEGCTSLTSITIPDGVTNIGKYAFYSCIGLSSVTISNAVINIGDHAFLNCRRLTNITIPDSVNSIGADAFSGCSGLASIEFEDINGWFVTDNYDNWINREGGIEIDATDINNNVTYFISTYEDYYWYRESISK